MLEERKRLEKQKLIF